MPVYVPLDGRPLRVQMGTRPLDPLEWIEIDENRADELAEKDRLLRDRRDEVLAYLPEGHAGSVEVLTMLGEYLPRRFPDVYGRLPSGAVEDRQLGRTVGDESEHPIEAAGRLVQEDLCVMSRGADGGWLLTAACVCFPSRWRLVDKIGRDLSGIHEPVPFYEERIGAVVSGLFDRLTVDRPLWRLNWTLLDDPALFQPVAAKEGRVAMPADVDLGAALHFRVERQTMRVLPETGDVLFTIRTYTRALGELELVRPGSFADLADSLGSTAPETIDYKGWTPLRERLVAWLRERASG